MKLIITTLAVFIGCSAAAQRAKYAEPNAALIETEPEPIHIEQMTIPAFDLPSSSASEVVAVNSIPDAPVPIPIAASIRAIPNRRSNDFKTFRSDRFNRMLVANEFLARGLDAWSTYRRLNDPCRCFREGSHFFGLNMTPALKNPAGAYSYSLGVATAYSFLSARLWNASKDHPRHARLLQRLSRALLIGDSSMEFTADIRNLTIARPRDQVKMATHLQR